MIIPYRYRYCHYHFNNVTSYGHGSNICWAVGICLFFLRFFLRLLFSCHNFWCLENITLTRNAYICSKLECLRLLKLEFQYLLFCSYKFQIMAANKGTFTRSQNRGRGLIKANIGGGGLIKFEHSHFQYIKIHQLTVWGRHLSSLCDCIESILRYISQSTYYSPFNLVFRTCYILYCIYNSYWLYNWFFNYILKHTATFFMVLLTLKLAYANVRQKLRT